MAAPALGLLIFFFGPAGAGKSTLAREWCNTRKRAAHIELDEVRNTIVAGLANPQSGSPAVSEQYMTSVTACCALARTFLNAGYDVAVDDAASMADFTERWKPNLAGLEWKTVIIRPNLATTLDKNDRRRKSVRPDIIRHQHMSTADWAAELIVDTTDLTVGESLQRMQEVLKSQTAA